MILKTSARPQKKKRVRRPGAFIEWKENERQKLLNTMNCCKPNSCVLKNVSFQSLQTVKPWVSAPRTPFCLGDPKYQKKPTIYQRLATKKNGAVNSVDHSIDTQLRFITARFRTTAEMFNPVRSRTCHARFSCAELVAMITNILTAVVFIPGCVCKIWENAKINWLITIFLALEVFPSAKVPFFRHTPPYCW